MTPPTTPSLGGRAAALTVAKTTSMADGATTVAGQSTPRTAYALTAAPRPTEKPLGSRGGFMPFVAEEVLCPL